MFLKKLEYLIQSHKINKRILSKECDIPYTTLDSFYKKGCDDIKLSNLRKISNYFNVDLNYWVDDLNITENNDVKIQLNPSEQTLLDGFRELNEDGQEKLIDYAEDLVSTNKYKKHSQSTSLSKKQA